jgi:hypothetical protein
LADIDREVSGYMRTAERRAERPFTLHAFPSFEELERRARNTRFRVVRTPGARPLGAADLPATATVGDFPMVVVNAPIYLAGLFRTARKTLGKGVRKVRQGWEAFARLASLVWAKTHFLMDLQIQVTAAHGALQVIETVARTTRETEQAVVAHVTGVWSDFADAFGSAPTETDLANARARYLRNGTLVATPGTP